MIQIVICRGTGRLIFLRITLIYVKVSFWLQHALEASPIQRV